MKWKKKKQSLSYLFKEELSPLLSSFEGKTILAVGNGQHPKLLKEYMGKRVSLETMIIMDDIMEFSKRWDNQLKDDIVWPKVKKLMFDYKKFLTYDKKKCNIIINDFVNQWYS